MNSTGQDKQIKKNVILSMSVQAVSFLVSLVLNLILPKYIDEYEYSQWQTFLLYVSFVPVLHFGFLDGFMLRYSQYDLDVLDKPLIRSQFKFFLIVEIFLSLCGLVIAQCFFEENAKLIVEFMSFAVITTNLYTYTSYLFQLTNRINKYAVLVLMLRILLGIGVGVVILFGGTHFYEICIVYFVAHAVAIVWGACNNKGLYLGSTVPLADCVHEVKENIASGSMLLIANISSMLLVGGAKMVVQWHEDALVFGQVAFSFNVSNLFLTFVTAASIAVFPSLKRIDEENLPDFYVKVRKSITPLLFLSLLAYFPGYYILNKWLPNYRSSLVYLGILMPIIVYSSRVTLLTNNFLKTLRKEKMMLMINLATVVVAFALFLFFSYMVNSVLLVLLSLVFVVVIQSIVSEIVVLKLIKRTQKKNLMMEIFLTVMFVFSIMCFNDFI